MAGESDRLFASFRLDPISARLWRGNEQIRLRPKTFLVLQHLVDHAGQLLTKAMLLDAVWPETVVSDSMPAVCVAELRAALGDNARRPRFIETVHRRGYRFTAPVRIASAPSVGESSRVAVRSKPILIGREAELGKLRRWHAEAQAGKRRVVFVVGEAGIGKSALVEEFLDSIAAHGTSLVGRGQCLEQYGAGEPYMPILEWMSRLSRERDGQRLVEHLRNSAPAWFAQISGPLTDVERARLRSGSQVRTQEQMLNEMHDALLQLTAEVPLVLLLEDLHWSDFSTLELIAAIAKRPEPARLLLIGTYRPLQIPASNHPLRTMKEDLERHHTCEELRLTPLSVEHVGEYVIRRIHGQGVRESASLARVIHARTDGNPLFMVNMVDFVLDDAGLLDSSPGMSAAEWLAAHRLNELSSVRHMIERNLQRLDPIEQEVLEAASVAGVEFSATSVAAALERSQAEIEARGARLARLDLFIGSIGPLAWPDGTMAAGFRFNHTLYKEALYSRLAVGHRIRLHQRIAAREEAGYRDRVGEIATELAYHYSQAHNNRKAIEYFQMAGDRAIERGAMVESEEHYHAALRLLSELPPNSHRDRQELTLQIALGGVLHSSRSWSHPERSTAYRRAGQLAETLGATNELGQALFGLMASALGSGRFKLAQELGEQMVEAAERGGDRMALRAAHSGLGEALLWQAHNLEAEKHLELGSAYDADDPAERVNWWGPPLLPIAVLTLGYPDRARRLMREALARAERHVNSFWMGHVHMWAGMFSAILGEAPALLDHSRALRRMAARHPVWMGFAEFYEGKALMIGGKWGEADGHLQKAIGCLEKGGLSGLLFWLKLDQADSIVAQRQIEPALTLIDEVIADQEFAYIRSRALRQRAKLLTEYRVDVAIVESVYRESIDCARLQSAKEYELQAVTDFARWLDSKGRTAEAHQMLADVYGWFTEGFDTITLRKAKALLDEFDGRN